MNPISPRPSRMEYIIPVSLILALVIANYLTLVEA
ncbi:unnamed protein product, partial [marine sediment metagenome]